jgi:mannose-6-phosphate isomerase-like protein (cupin superfamily)
MGIKDTWNPTPAEVQARVARFESLGVIQSQQGHELPQQVADLIWSRRLLPVLTRIAAVAGPFGTVAPIQGAGDMSITYAVCPPGTGPSLHSHRKTFETFTVLRGRFTVFLGDDGSESVTLEPCDVISVPPGVCRGFRNTGEEEGVLQVIITGGIHDQNDIVFPASTAQEIAIHGAHHLEYFKEAGLVFEGETASKS